MKKLLAGLLVVVMVFGLTAYADDAVLTKDVVVLFTSDAHCGIDQGFGYVGVAALRDQIAKKNHVVLVDNGDAIQGETVGTMTKGSAVMEVMSTVGYDVVIPGNHEFDYGMENFLELAQNAPFPYVSCNFTYKDEPVFAPYVIKEFDGVKIAFVGVTTPDTIIASTHAYFQDEEGNYVYGFCGDKTGEALYTAVQKAVDDARAEGAAYVILQAHLGIQESCSPWMSTEVIENTTGITAVLDGHSHSELEQEIVKNKDGEDTLLVACGTKLKNVGYLRIAQDGALSSGLYTWAYDVSLPDMIGETEVSKAVVSVKSQLDSKLEEVVAASQVDLTIYAPAADVEGDKPVRIVRNMETNLGDLCADAYRIMGGADIGLINGGGVRVSIPAGDITLNDILSVHPFGNGMCVAEATGQQILDALEWSSRAVPSENGGFLQVSGLTYEIHAYIESSVISDDMGSFAGVSGEYRVKNVMVNGEPLDPEKTYTVSSTNFLLKNGADGTNLFVNCNLVVNESMLDNQMLINYITEILGGVIGEDYADPYGQGRIVIYNEAP